MHDLAEQREPEAAAEMLVPLLVRGELVLMLGAGASAALGLPCWSQLVERCAQLSGTILDTDGDLLQQMDKVRRHTEKSGYKGGFEACVKEGLYGGLPGGANESFDLESLRTPMLLALGALAMPSRGGTVAEVINFNFDNVLQSYLNLHGFRTDTVVDTQPRLRGDIDVTIFHPHGFLPRGDSRSQSRAALVLSQSQYVDRISGKDRSTWPTILLSRFQTKTFIAVGLSMSDINLLQLLRRVDGTAVPIGYVLGRHSEDDIDRLAEDNMVPVHFEDFTEIPNFLLEVCRGARQTR